MLGTVTLLIVAGVTAEPDQSGSLFRPAATTLLPLDWAKMPLSLGLLMSPWTAHAILPNLYRDMAETRQIRHICDRCGDCNSGYLMYGEATTDEITNNVIAATKSRSLAIVLTVLVALMPISKVPLT
ncbi:hypothetical protein IEQ34_025531 [Dendrobium chrysotoxum]|uniref:Uncharacterized protein n=1 Tax=Dendrobium chrysotoxum TaxID=161865 RepID=A0AAV7FJ04_DENCH|nr:hypothetical protein IEQ34_025531 [Dendrobium chrysotoxum]